MAGINRFGKAPAKPGTLRPTDPNRFKTEDFFSVDAEEDPEYIRRVVEVETLAARGQGCVLAKGAFDRDDALYLRDEAEKARHRELELRDAEMGKFTRIRHQENGRGGLADADSPARKRPAPSRKVPVVQRQAAHPAGSPDASGSRATSEPPAGVQAPIAHDAPTATHDGAAEVPASAAKHPAASNVADQRVATAALADAAKRAQGSAEDEPAAALGLGYTSDSESDTASNGS